MAKYDESSISWFSSDLAKIRSRPSMYIGSTDADGVFNLVRECADNGLDEAKAGRNSYVGVAVDDDGVIRVWDKGVGIPVKMHPKAKVSTLTHILTSLQSSGKMRGDAYKNAIGTHGAGLKAVNALSEYLKVWTYRKDAGGWHYTEFARGKQKVAVKKSSGPQNYRMTPFTEGTFIEFKPDAEILRKPSSRPLRCSSGRVSRRT